MNNSFLKIGVSLAAAMAFVTAAHATKIQGEINLSGIGIVELINDVGTVGAASPTNADKLNFSSSGSSVFGVANTGNNASVQAGLLDFSGMQGVNGTIQDFGFNPSLSIPAGNPLWTLTNGVTFSLDAINLVDQATSGFLNLRGSGRFNMPTFEETAGTWSLTITTTGSLFTWTNSQATVPDSGSTLALLGLGLIAIAAARRRLA